ncbi:MAG TPA: hypothetical protein VJH70_00405 [Candidatus Paceibacterota bacterium]
MLQKQLVKVVGYLPSDTIPRLLRSKWEPLIPVPGRGWISYLPVVSIQKEHLLSDPYVNGNKTAFWEILIQSESSVRPLKLMGYFYEELEPYPSTEFSPLPIVRFFNFVLFSKPRFDKIKMERHWVEINTY